MTNAEETDGGANGTETTDDGESRDGRKSREGERSRGGERACYLRICPACDATCSVADERCPDCGAALEPEPTAE